MNKHCKGCLNHCNSKYPKDSPSAKKYNDWCCLYGNTAKKVVDHCILNKGKRT